MNYLDRQVLSLTWDEFIKPEFHWDESHYGTITSVFSIAVSYTHLDVYKRQVETNEKIERLLLAVHSAFNSLMERKKDFDAAAVKDLSLIHI